MATLWVIHTILMLIFYRELYDKRSQEMAAAQENDEDDDDDDCFEKEVENGSVSHSVSPTHTRTLTRDRAPSMFFSYVYNGTTFCLG